MLTRILIVVPTALATPTKTSSSFSAAAINNLDRPCLIADQQTYTYAQIADQIQRRMVVFGAGRRLVHLTATNTIDFVISYLAAREAGHVVLLSAIDADIDPLHHTYAPDTVVDATDTITHRSALPQHEFHPDLALLLSTSGSTGSPKLVRLSHANLDSNAQAIAQSLNLAPNDRGITALPLSYCYGLSVLHSHLLVGASMVLTENSVVDECFWKSMRTHGITNLAGVPHTFNLIQRVGISRLDLPDLRLVTQAGGRLAPDQVQTLARLGTDYGWDFFVMYGQTEATARMAVLPAEFAEHFPDRVGLPVDGGSFAIRPLPESALPTIGQTHDHAEAGEVIYRGPNVMMGYAETAADLCRGPELHELATGDLGRIDDQGFLQIVGRTGRFAKLFGLRIDLARLEKLLDNAGISALCVSDDSHLTVVTETPNAEAVARQIVSSHAAIPARLVTITTVDKLPRFASGKPDFQTAMRLGTAVPETTGNDLAGLYASMLSIREAQPTDTFVSLGGDSLTYVELSVRLEDLLGELPSDWHLQTIAQLESTTSARSRWVARVETNVVLRAVAICLIVSSHMRMFYVPVGAHILFTVGGYNFARFQLQETHKPGWRNRMARPYAKLAAITSLWVVATMAIWGGHSLQTIFLVNNYLGQGDHTGHRWRYWYLEAMVQIGIVLVALFWFKPLRRLERRWPLLFVLVVLLPTLVIRFEWLVLGPNTRNAIFQTDTVIWAFVFGWAIQRSKGLALQALMSGIAFAVVPGYFLEDARNIRLLVAILVLIWIPSLPVPRPLNRIVGWLASASLAIYLTHYLVHPPLRRSLPMGLAFTLTMLIGIATWYVTSTLTARWQRRVGTKGLLRWMLLGQQ